MPTQRKKRKHAKRDHIRCSPDAAIVLRPPSPPAVAPVDPADHLHRKNHKGRVIVNVWSRRFNACYETEFCPDCPIKEVRKTLLNFCQADKSYFAAARWLKFEGLNPDTLKMSFNPNSTSQMDKFVELIKSRDRHGGKITMRIVRGGQAVINYTVISNAKSRYADLCDAGLLLDRVRHHLDHHCEYGDDHSAQQARGHQCHLLEHLK